MKKKFRVIVREIVGTDSIGFSKVYDFPCLERARMFFYTAIGDFLYNIDDLEDIYKRETEDTSQLDVFCRGFYRQFILYK